ncbi:MAG: serine hydrolase [Bacteroidota bacterium]
MNLTVKRKPAPKFIGVIIFGIFLFFISWVQPEKQEKSAVSPSSDFQREYATPESQGMSSQKLDEMRSILAEKGTKKLMIIKNNKIVYEWFSNGNEDSVKKHYTASLAKALVGGMSLAAAMSDGYITLDEAACNYVPEWKEDGRKQHITIRQLATHTSGIEDAEATEEDKKKMEEGDHSHMDLPGWKGQFWRQEPDPFLVSRDSAPVIFTPGEQYAYSNPGIGMLTYAVTASLKDSKYSDVRTYLKERIHEPIGIDEDEYGIGYGKTFTAGTLQLVPSWGGGSYTARSIARIGLLMLHKGNWQGNQLIDSSAVEKVTRYGDTALPTDIRNKDNPMPATTSGWYSNFNGVWGHVPRDAFAGHGAGNQILMVIPSIKMVIVRMGSNLFDESKGESKWQAYEKYLFNPIMDAIEEPPYPKSELAVEFAPEDSVIRLADGSDCWPSTWADDGDLYTAYGDGWGFSPKTDIKLSQGLAKVIGTPPDIEGINIRSSTGERVGQGKFGEKPSGMLMVDGILYMLSRNAQNAILTWSSDHGKTWEQADWKFDISFGYPTFLNYGKNYEGAPDNYVYVYSHDEADAYKNSDQFVMARVPKNQIKDWRKYEYFAGFTEDNKPIWSEDIRKRKPVFTNPGKCYRSGITYNKGLKKYLWCQTILLAPSEGQAFDGRFKSGLGIFESPNPWGPWKTVYYTRNWDIGPGETSSIPTKWMSEDGKSGYLLFSGDDYFSVRGVEFKLK